MEVKVSAKWRKTCDSAGLSPEQMAFADLVAVGWSVEDAWAVTIRKGAVWDKAQLKREQAQLEESVAVQNRISSIKQTLRNSQIEKITQRVTNDEKAKRAAILARATSKEEMLISLQTALSGFAMGSPEWVKTNQMIIDVSRMKQDEIKEEDSTIHYYLPVNYPTSCRNCLLNPYNKQTSR